MQKVKIITRDTFLGEKYSYKIVIYSDGDIGLEKYHSCKDEEGKETWELYENSILLDSSFVKWLATNLEVIR